MTGDRLLWDEVIGRDGEPITWTREEADAFYAEARAFAKTLEHDQEQDHDQEDE